MKSCTISEAATLLGMSVHTLRYYERAGLLDTVPKVAGRRRYSETELTWLRFIQRLRATGMSMQLIDLYARLRRQGKATIDARMNLLQEHLHQLALRDRELAKHREALMHKIRIYQQMQRRVTECNQSTEGEGE